jgi:galactokinase
MSDNELLNKLDSQNTAKIFAELYGENEVESARARYKKLITEFPGDSVNLRVFSAPGRTELAGNHTDHNRGKVLAASIQLDSAAIVGQRDDNTVFFRSTGYQDVIVKLTDSNGKPDLLPKKEEIGTTEALARGIAAELVKRTGKPIGGFSANADSTVLPGSGLSSSAAVEVLLCRIFDSLYGEGKRSSLEIAQIGQIAENAYFGKPCGLMDQTACASGGAVAIDFADAANPQVKQIEFDLASAGYCLCIVNTGGNHADLTADYASIPSEMKEVAAFFGGQALGEIDREAVLSRAAEVRKQFGDRSLLRAMHFFDENARVDKMASALEQKNLGDYLALVNESGDSSWQFLQNVYAPHNPKEQGISAALALTKDFFKKNKMVKSACRVHGGGFAGTIQAYLQLDALNAYRSHIEAVFGAEAVTVLRIRPIGAVELIF